MDNDWMSSFIARLDFGLLREQKDWLMSAPEGTPQAIGLMNMIDKIQDTAVALGWTEMQVFGQEITEDDDAD